VSSWETAASIPLALLLWRRLTGRIETRKWPQDVSSTDDAHDPNLIWGPWRIPEPLGTIVNAIALGWIILAFFFSFWPSTLEVTPETMNFSSLMTGFWFLFGLMYYFAMGRKVCNLPIFDNRIRFANALDFAAISRSHPGDLKKSALAENNRNIALVPRRQSYTDDQFTRSDTRVRRYLKLPNYITLALSRPSIRTIAPPLIPHLTSSLRDLHCVRHCNVWPYNVRSRLSLYNLHRETHACI
jgi:hypothetical protein